MRWRIYYDDGSTFSSKEGKPEDAPGFGVVALAVVNDDVGREVLSGHDFYYCVDGVWTAGDWFGLIERLCHSHPITAVKSGRNMPTPEYRALRAKAERDPGMQPKTAYYKDERRLG